MRIVDEDYRWQVDAMLGLQYAAEVTVIFLALFFPSPSPLSTLTFLSSIV